MTFSQNGDTLYINYLSQSPFAFNEKEELKGIEIEVINEYVFWLKSKKKMNINLKHRSFNSFNDLMEATKKGRNNSLGLASAQVTPERIKEVDFTCPYLKKVAFCITNGHAPDIKIESKDEIMRALGSMEALTINNSTLNKYVMELKKKYLPELKISYHSDEKKILDEISKNVLFFGYVDAVAFYTYLKTNPSKFIKMQKLLNQNKEEIAFMVPKGSTHKQLFTEFFTGPNGFKNSQNYRFILEKYLGAYMTSILAIN